jgi:hypothetical protein
MPVPPSKDELLRETEARENAIKDQLEKQACVAILAPE